MHVGRSVSGMRAAALERIEKRFQSGQTRRLACLRAADSRANSGSGPWGVTHNCFFSNLLVPPLRRVAYEIAGMAFMRRHVCRMADFPLVLCQDYLARNQQVYETLWGPSEFFATGVLADWNVEPRLNEITVPTLILSGRFDEATPAQQQRLHEGIPGSRWTVLEHSAHLTFMEEPDRYREVLTSFLDNVDTGTPMFGSAPSTPP